MRIAVTGGSGFIGAATVREAERQGHTAWSVDHQTGHDVRVVSSLEQGLSSADTVIHLAGMLGTAELFDAPHEAVDANVNGTLNVLEWCAEHRAGYVGITMPDSSWANVYQATKLCAMRLATAWHRSRGVPVTHVRAFNAYGPGQKWGPGHPQKIVPTFAVHAWRRQPIPVWGDGWQTVDLVHVDDVARMLVDATDRARFGRDQILDAGTGVSKSVRAIANYINNIAQSKAGIEFLPMRDGETSNTSICAEGESWEKLGWQPQFDWDRLAETVHAYRGVAEAADHPEARRVRS